MLKSYKQADYSLENWKTLLDIKAAADKDIDNATSVTDVMTALNNADNAMAAVHTLLEDAKATAHASLNAAVAGYAQSDYSPENWNILINAITIGDIDSADSVADVTAALDYMQAEMAAVHTLLTDARIAAYASLENALAVYTEADYTPEDWAALNGFKTAGDTAIDGAADLAGVEAALSAAIAGMNGVLTIAQTLAEAKAAAHDALATAFGTYQESDYTGDDWIVLTGFKTDGDASIDEAADLAGVEAAQSAATAGMGGVSTIAQTLAAAKSVAHGVLAAAYGAYPGGDYTDDDWRVLTGFRTDGHAAIDEAVDLAGVEAALSKAVAGMEGVPTIAQTLAAAKSVAHDVLAGAFTICEGNDAADGDAASIESEMVDDMANDIVVVIDLADEPTAEDLPIIEARTEVAEDAPANDETATSLELPNTVSAAIDGVQEQAADLEPAAEDVPIIETGIEAADADPVNDETEAVAEEALETGTDTHNTVQEQAADLEPATEGIASDTK